MTAMISLEGLAKRYPLPGGGATTIFQDLWLSVNKGEFVCIIGHSGCGKTTVLNSLAGLDEPSEGVVIVDGREIAGPGLDRAMIFQGHALLPWKTVMGNVAYAVSSRWPRATRMSMRLACVSRCRGTYAVAAVMQNSSTQGFESSGRCARAAQGGADERPASDYRP